MNVSPVSFRSLMCFQVDDNKPKAQLENMVSMAFAHNPDLTKHDFQLVKKSSIYDKPVDVTVYNANANICQDLDKHYKQELPKGSRQVFLTKIPVAVNPYDVVDRYFLTAATDEDENKILYSSFANGRDIIVAKFKDKNI